MRGFSANISHVFDVIAISHCDLTKYLQCTECLIAIKGSHTKCFINALSQITTFKRRS